jgi:hypothetical protein
MNDKPSLSHSISTLVIETSIKINDKTFKKTGLNLVNLESIFA